MFYNGPMVGVSGDSYVSFTETLTELAPTGLAQDLVAYWQLDEASGVRDDLIGANHLTDVNTVGSATGKRNTAASFVAASSEELTAPDAPALSMGDIPFTLAAWVYLTSLPGTGAGRTIIEKYRTPLDSNDDWEYEVIYDGTVARFSFQIGNGAGSSGSIKANSFGAASTGTWYLVVAWHDSVTNTINIQVNNGTVDSTSYTAGSYDSSGTFRIGGQAHTAYFMDGRIDGVAIWNRILTSSERSDLYNAGAGWDEALPFSATATNRIAMVV